MNFRKRHFVSILGMSLNRRIPPIDCEVTWGGGEGAVSQEATVKLKF